MGDDELSSKKVDQMSQKKECPVCKNEFSLNDHRLKLLACSHEVCIGCVKGIDKCPLCKERLNVIDLQTTDFINRRGFDCFTCKTRRPSEKMRICVTCSENGAVLVKPGKLQECSSYIFCIECTMEDHMEKGHRQEKLINYDEDGKTIKEMQKTCLSLKPILERIATGLEERAENYRRMMEAVDLVLSPDVDIRFAHLQSASTVLQKCLQTAQEDSDVHRRSESNWLELKECLATKREEDNAKCDEQSSSIEPEAMEWLLSAVAYQKELKTETTVTMSLPSSSDPPQAARPPQATAHELVQLLSFHYKLIGLDRWLQTAAQEAIHVKTYDGERTLLSDPLWPVNYGDMQTIHMYVLKPMYLSALDLCGYSGGNPVLISLKGEGLTHNQNNMYGTNSPLEKVIEMLPDIKYSLTATVPASYNQQLRSVKHGRTNFDIAGHPGYGFIIEKDPFVRLTDDVFKSQFAGFHFVIKPDVFK